MIFCDRSAVNGVVWPRSMHSGLSRARPEASPVSVAMEILAPVVHRAKGGLDHHVLLSVLQTAAPAWAQMSYA
jgi:hypothetical protein